MYLYITCIHRYTKHTSNMCSTQARSTHAQTIETSTSALTTHICTHIKPYISTHTQIHTPTHAVNTLKVNT